MDIFRSFEDESRKVDIFYDREPVFHPRRDVDCLGTIVSWHRRYSFSDRTAPSSLSPVQFRALYTEKNYIILPLYLFDHSGLSLSTTPFGCPWDSGQAGYIYVSCRDARKKFGVKRVTKKIRERAEEILRLEVQEYDDFLQGNIFGFCTYERQLDGEWEEIDRSYGFLGEDFETNGISDSLPPSFRSLLLPA